VFVAVAALVSFGILAGVGTGHLIRLRGFAAAIAAQRVWPSAVAFPLAGLIATSEAGIGVAGLASVTLSGGGAQGMLLAAAAALYGCYTVYGLLLLWKRPGVPCACSHGVEALDRAVVGRAAALATLALVALLNAPVAQSLSGQEAVVTALAALAYAIGIWAFPAALRDPFESIAAIRARGAS
jgi:hypothetical protein